SAEMAENADAEGAAAATAARNRPVTTRRAVFFVSLRVFVLSWETTPRADTVVDSTRRRFHGDCRISRNWIAGQRNGRTYAAPRGRGDGLEPHRVEGARARIARGAGRGDTRRRGCRRRPRSHDPAR